MPPAEPMQTPPPPRERMDYLARIPKAQAQESAQERPDLGGAEVAGHMPETTKRPSYEADAATKAPETGRLAEIVAAARERLANLADRMERAFFAVLGRHQAQEERAENERRLGLHLPARIPEKSPQDLAAENRREDPHPEIRPAERMVDHVEATREPQTFEQRKAEARRKLDELKNSPPSPTEDRERERHHRPFLHDILGRIRKHYHRRPKE